MRAISKKSISGNMKSCNRLLNNADLHIILRQLGIEGCCLAARPNAEGGMGYGSNR